MPFQTRQLGRNGPSVPPMGFGLMGLGHGTYGAVPDEETSFTLLDRAHELGNRFWDTADLYGISEELVGRWFQRTGNRKDIFLATKFGFVAGSKAFETDSSAEYCKKACAASLKALGVDHIDLYYLHSANPQTPIEETMRAMAELQASGKITHIGLSAVSSSTLRRAVKIAPVAAVQTGYSPFERYIENAAGTDLLATCRESGVAVVAAMPLGRGLLTSTFAADENSAEPGDMRPLAMPRFMPENRAENVHVVQRFKVFADRKGCSTAQFALAWLLRQGEDIIPIPGTRKLQYLEENWRALDIDLSDDEAAEINSFLDSASMAGEALPPAFKGYAFKETVEEA